MIYVIYGQERYLMDAKLKKLIKDYQVSRDEMTLSSYDLNETTMQQAYEDFITPPFLAQHKMIVVTNPLFLTAAKLKKDNHDREIMERVVKEDNETVVMVLFLEGTLDSRLKINKLLRKTAKMELCEKLTYFKLSDATRRAISARQATISNDALELLLNRGENSLLKLQSEVEKLTLYTKRIRIDDVRALVTKPLDENVFDLTNALLQKNRAQMFQVYQDLMILNEEPVKLIALIAGSLRLIYQVKFLDRKGYNDKEIGRLLGVNPYRLKYIRNDCGNFQINEVLDYLAQLSELDVNIKRGLIDKNIGLELFMMKI